MFQKDHTKIEIDSKIYSTYLYYCVYVIHDKYRDHQTSSLDNIDINIFTKQIDFTINFMLHWI